MEKHRVIIGWLFEAVTMLLAVFVTFVWKKAFGTDGTLQEQQIVVYAVVIAVLYLAVGLTLILNYRHAAWVCLPFSVMMLIYIPIGTALGGYYLWYFWKYVYRRVQRPTSIDALVDSIVQSEVVHQTCLDEGKFETGGINPTRILCSDNECPCTDEQPLIIGHTAYMYISPEVVKFRKDCRTLLERNVILEKLASKTGASLYVTGGIANPFYLCETGARRRGLDMAVALADAKMVAETGFAPLRPTPMAT